MVFKIRRTVSARIIVIVAWLGGMLGALLLPTAPAVQADRLPRATATPSSAPLPLLLSLAADQKVMGLRVADEDILLFDGQNWQLIFDGSDVGAGKTDLVAFAALDPDSLLMTFGTRVKLDGMVVMPHDIVRFDASSLGDTTSGTFRLYFDGSDVDLTTGAERLDALASLPDGRLLISTSGNPMVTGVSGADEDILIFTPASLGDFTFGSWSLYFDGSDVGLGTNANEDIDAADVSSDGVIYLSTFGNFSVDGVKGADEDVFACIPGSLGTDTACEFSPTLYFDGSGWGLTRNDVDAFHYIASSVPTATATPTQPPSKPTFPPNAAYISLPSNLDHESGDFRQYMAVETDGGDLAVAPQAALGGTGYGLQIQVDDSHRAFAYAALETASTTGVVRARFYIDPNGLRMEHLAQVNVLYLMNSYGVSNFALMKLMRVNGRYFLRGVMIDDNGLHRETDVWPIGDEPHSVEIQVRRASSPSSNDATYETWIDGVRKTTMTGIDSYWQFIDFQYLSVGLNSMAGTVNGVYYVDEIAVNDDGSEFGMPGVDGLAPASSVGLMATPTVTPQPTKIAAE